MRMIKYLVYPGEVNSQNDGDIHFISFKQLVQLYGVNPRECIDATKISKKALSGLEPTCTKLFPRYNGDYKIR